MSAVVSGREDDNVAAGGGEHALQTALTWALGALGFFLPFSTAGTSVSLGVLVVLSLFMPARLLQQRPWREPVLACGLLLFAYIAVAVLVREDWSRAAFGAINSYHELLMLPLLWALLRVARRPNAFVNGLMLGALAYAAIHWLVPLSPKLAWFMHTRRISAGFALAVCAFLFFEHARLRRIPRAPGFAAAAFLAATILFAGDGRTGHLILLTLLACSAWRAAPRRLRMLVMLATLAAGLLVAATSASVRQRMGETLDAIERPRDPTSIYQSTSVRYEMLRIGLGVGQQYWPWGTGWEKYPAAFSRGAQDRNAQHMFTPDAANPHNEYLLLLGTSGLPALLLFLGWVGLPMVRAAREHRPDRPWAGAVGCVALAFALAALFNSVLMDYTEGHFYAALLAWLLVRRTQD